MWLIRIATVTMLGLVGVLAWQAERGLPLLHPDRPVGLTALALMVLAAVAAAS